jgi:hypothetical protein
VQSGPTAHASDGAGRTQTAAGDARALSRPQEHQAGRTVVPDVVWIADIAKRLRLDFTTVRRLIAKEKDALQITLRRGKGDKLFLSREDAEKLIASYEARRGGVTVAPEEADPATYDRHGYFYLIQQVRASRFGRFYTRPTVAAAGGS